MVFELDFQCFADCRIINFAVDGNAEPVTCDFYREYLSAKPGVFNLHIFRRTVGDGCDPDPSGKVSTDAKDVIEDHLCAGN